MASQKGEGWRLLSDPYDDDGASGGTLKRPGLQRLPADIEAAKVDCLTRSLADFTGPGCGLNSSIVYREYVDHYKEVSAEFFEACYEPSHILHCAEKRSTMLRIL